MAEYLIQSETLTAIGDSIRAKTYSDALIIPEDMPAAIADIQTGELPPTVHALTIHAVNEAGEPVAEDVVIYCDEGCAYDYAAPELPDMFAKPSHLKGVATEDAELTIVYSDWDYESRYTFTVTTSGSVTLRQSLLGTATVDWGDGTEPETVTSTKQETKALTHSYIESGTYTVVVTSESKDINCSPHGYNNTTNIIGGGTLNHVHLGHNALFIGDHAFRNGASCTFDPLPETLIKINDYAFCGCTALDLTVLPDSVTSIGSCAFEGCSLFAPAMLPTNLTTIGIRAFKGCTIFAPASLPDSVVAIPQNAFSGCSALTWRTLPGNITSIGNSAFNGCIKLLGFDLPPKVATIGSYAFSSCSRFARITMPDTLSSIENYFLSGTTVKNVRLPMAMATWIANLFGGCSTVEAIEAPGVATVASSALTSGSGSTQNTALKTLTLGSPGNPVMSIASNAFSPAKNATDLTITVYTINGEASDVSGAPWGATNASVQYIKA